MLDRKPLASWRIWIISQIVYRPSHPLPHIARQPLDLFPGTGNDIDCVAAHSSVSLASSHLSQPARFRSPPKDPSSSQACSAIWTSSSVSTHSIRASQSSMSMTARRFPFAVTYWTDCSASSPVIGPSRYCICPSSAPRWQYNVSIRSASTRIILPRHRWVKHTKPPPIRGYCLS